MNGSKTHGLGIISNALILDFNKNQAQKKHPADISQGVNMKNTILLLYNNSGYGIGRNHDTVNNGFIRLNLFQISAFICNIS